MTGHTSPTWGSDYIVDVLDAFDHPYVAFNPGASFRGIEESIVNYNDETPTVIETPNEGLSVSIAHGYAKATGEPGLCVLHNVVGTLNGAMELYNAYVDRVPIVALSGTGPLRKSQRRPWIDWIHSAHIQGNLVREFVKWDAQPDHIDGVAESLLRAHEIAETRPKGPTYVTLDHELQEAELDDPLDLPDPEAYPTPSRMAPDPAAIDDAASALVDAEFPVVLVDQVGDSERAVDALVDLAEALGAPVLDIMWRRFNFPNTHPMYLSESDAYEEADVVLNLDVWEQDWVTGDWSTSLEDAVGDDTTFIDVGTHELEASGLFPKTYRVHSFDIPILADTALAVPALRDAVVERLDRDEGARRRAERRYERVARLHEEQQDQWEARAEDVWDDSPVAPARLAAELWDVIEDEQWALVNDMFPRWADRLWDVDEFDQYIGGTSGGGAVGYGIGASIGAALAYAESDRVPINLQADGDLMQYVGALWVLGHYEIPLLTVMHNNRSMHNSTNHRMELAEYRGRNASHEGALVGTGIWDPVPDYASIAESFGVTGYGPIEEPADLGPVLADAFDDVANGEPVLVDVVCQAR